MLGQEDVGHRVVVRRVVGVRDGRPLFADTLGELIGLTSSHLTVATATGPVQVPLGDVRRAKRVPPARRPGAAAVTDLELAADEAWPAPDRDRLGGWLLRAANGWTGRANSALPVGDPDRPLPAAIDAVVAWYARRGQPALVNVPLPLAAPVGAELDRRGWRARPLVLVQTAALGTLLHRLPAGPDLAQVQLDPSPGDDWIALTTGGRGGLPRAARPVLTGVDQVRFAGVYRDGKLLAAGRGTVTGAGRWLGLTLIEVVPAARRRGLARLVIGALAQWAAGVGARDAFLQVMESNTAAVTLYRKLGFITHHTYLTRVAPDGAGPGDRDPATPD